MKKIRPPNNWPIEKGKYVVGNPLSPAAVVVILASPYDRIPNYVEELVRTAIESGAAIGGTLQTANIGIEKIIINIVSNPNIRFVVVVGKESLGHYPGDAFRAFVLNGIDENQNIIGSRAPIAIIKNLPIEAIKRFRDQVTLIDLLGINDSKVVEKVVWTTYQERQTTFEVDNKKYTLYDPGAYSAQPLICRLTDKLSSKQEE